jgi:pimeloyl-ACP methyl ester carboxylesterase
MNDAVLESVRESVQRMDGKAPRWLAKGVAPDFPVVESGDKGPTMLLLHGLFGALSNWDSTLPLFSKFSKCVALQFPILTGHSSEVKVKALAAFTEYYIRSNNLGPVILCGNSLGGHVALRVALSSPELVDCLLLSGSSGLYEHTADTLPVRPNSDFIREHMGRVFYNREFITDEAVDEIMEILSKRSNHLNLIHAARSAKKDNLQEILSQVKAPTLLLWGENDEVTTMDVANIFDSKLPNSKLVSVAGCGHAPMIEHPEWFANEVKNFIEANSQFYKKD